MKVTVDGLAWLPKRDMYAEHVAYLKQVLTLTPRTYREEDAEPMALFVETETHIGIPRQFFMERRSRQDLQIQLQTTDGSRGSIFVPPGEFNGELRPHQKQAFAGLMPQLMDVQSLGGIFQAPTGFGKCVVGSTLIATDMGLISIRTLVGTDYEDDIDKPVDPLGAHVTAAGLPPRRATVGYYKGIHETWAVETTSGFRVMGTPEHPLRVMGVDGPEWREIKDICYGDWVELRSFAFATRDAASVKPDTAALMGYISGGALTPAGEVLSAACKYRVESAKENYIRSNSWLLEDATDRCVPDTILRADRASVLAYVQAYLDAKADFDEYGEFYIQTACIDFREEFQLLLLGFGIHTRTDNDPKKIRIRRGSLHAFATIFRFDDDHRTSHLKERLAEETPHSFPVPFAPLVSEIARLWGGIPQIDELLKQGWGRELPFWAVLEAQHYFQKSAETLVTAQPKQHDDPGRLLQLTRMLDKLVHDILERHVFWDPVLRAQPSGGCEEVYDLTVPEGNWFLGGGIVCHNTVMSCAVISKLQVPALVLVHNKMLRDQWIAAFDQFLPQAEVGTIQGPKWDFEGKSVVVAMIQTLANKADDLPKELLDFPGLLITDEAHHQGSKKWSQVVPPFPARLRLGITATPRRKDGMEDVFFWHIGKILYAARRGIVKPKVKMVQSDFMMPHSKKHNPDVVAEHVAMRYLIDNRDRNDMVADYAVRATSAGRNVIIITKRVAHLHALKEAVEKRAQALPRDQHPTVSICSGGVEGDELERAKQAQIIIATAQYVREGFDVPRLDTLILAAPMVDVEQTVGRITRICEGKKEPWVVDIVDDNIGVFYAYASKRRDFYERKGYIGR